jgi:N-succinyldiaminopimelate aminotransferase
MPHFPRTASSADGLPDRVFSRLASRVDPRGGRVFPLHIGDTWLEPLAAARAEAQRTDDCPRLHNYTAVQGEPVLLDAIAAHLEERSGSVVERDRVLVTSGATAGLSSACEALLDPGEEVLLPAPFWPLIRGIVKRRGARAVEVPFFTRLDEPGFDPEAELEARVTEHTAAIYVNTPHNPTGRVLPAAVLAAIGRVAARHALWILADETYDQLAFDAAAPTSPWTRPDFAGRTVAVHSVSKTYALAGARVGFAHGPREVVAAMRAVQTYSTFCAPRPMQRGAARALLEGAAWLAEARRTYEDAGRRAAAALGVPPPEGGTFLFFDVGPMLLPGEAPMGFLERCLDAGVLLTPGASSGRDYEGWARLCFTSVQPAELDEALARLAPLVRPVTA